jgi:hypothetical protein
MYPQDELEHYEATEAQDLIRLSRALRPPERDVQVPMHVDMTIQAELWKAQALRQIITLLPLTRRELVEVVRQALMENLLLEEVARVEDGSAWVGSPGRSPPRVPLSPRRSRVWRAMRPRWIGWARITSPRPLTSRCTATRG